MKKFSIILFVLASCKVKYNSVIQNVENECGDSKIEMIYYKKDFASKNHNIVFRSDFNDSIKLYVNNRKITKSFIRTQYSTDLAKSFQIIANNNDEIKVEFSNNSKKSFCFKISENYYLYSIFLDSMNVKIYAEKNRNMNFE